MSHDLKNVTEYSENMGESPNPEVIADAKRKAAASVMEARASIIFSLEGETEDSYRYSTSCVGIAGDLIRVAEIVTQLLPDVVKGIIEQDRAGRTDEKIPPTWRKQ